MRRLCGFCEGVFNLRDCYLWWKANKIQWIYFDYHAPACDIRTRKGFVRRQRIYSDRCAYIVCFAFIMQRCALLRTSRSLCSVFFSNWLTALLSGHFLKVTNNLLTKWPEYFSIYLNTKTEMERNNNNRSSSLLNGIYFHKNYSIPKCLDSTEGRHRPLA